MPYKDPQQRREYQRTWIAERRLAFFADKSCVVCGRTTDLELDHVDPTKKVDHRIWSWAADRRMAEITKCQVLCQEHHKQKSSLHRQRDILHGTHDGYAKHACRCGPCTIAHTEYNRKWRAQKASTILDA